MLDYITWTHENSPEGVNIPEKCAVRWVYDENYEPDYDTGDSALTEELINEERQRIESGQYIVLGCIVQEHCPRCEQWADKDSLWGIIIVNGADDELINIFKYNMNPWD